MMDPFRLFSLVFSYPTEETIRELAHLRLDGECAGTFCCNVLCTTPLEELQAEYTRLFINAYPSALCPPYESFYREGTVYGATSGDVEQVYLDNGLDYVFEGEPPDFLSVELDFLAVTHDEAFLGRLKEWVFRFTAKVREHSGIYGVCAVELEMLLRDGSTAPNVTYRGEG
ncbi:MAG: molecular chaperone TorD family protein [Thermodesulfovibrionales bacterium]